MKPINPFKIFGFDEVREAFRLLGSGKHIGKIVVSNASDANIDIKVCLFKHYLNVSGK